MADSAGRAAPRPGTEATVFGLDIRSGRSLELLQRTRAAPTGRTLAVTQIDRSATELGWTAGASTICRQSSPDGSTYFRIQSHPRRGYLLWGEGVRLLPAVPARASLALRAGWL